MDWIKLAIPLIVLAFWILGHLLKNQQEAPKPMPRRLPPKPDEEPSGPRPRQHQGDVDRFLEEVRRRRESQPSGRTMEEEDAESGRSADVAKTPPVLARRPVPPPAVQPVAQATIKRRPLREAPTPPAASAAKEVIVAQAVSNISAVNIPPTAGPPPALPPPAGSWKASPAALQLLQLLRTPSSLGTAVLLHEIFEPPLSRRTKSGRGGRA